ncbi:hypothetical protein Asi02nite_37880 [Asanoa siamensis]|uniref:Uncharacterized protein n=1 Tax=Asanoa siamensis TaxID=926357 RepID=A0ABQ4CSL4_9ACTN|nr:hypothetical protein Asi02nite_37880 [Asanoa siamensis]
MPGTVARALTAASSAGASVVGSPAGVLADHPVRWAGMADAAGSADGASPSLATGSTPGSE